MKRFMTKKVLVVGVAVALVLGVGGAAFAYWTTTGSGNGSAKVGTASAVTIAQIGTPAYNSTIGLADYAASQAFNGPEITQFGNEVNLAYTGPLTSAVVAMSNFSPTAFSTPITVSIYAPGNLTSPLTSDTATIAVPSCDVASADCIDYDGTFIDMFNATFSSFIPAVVLPSTVVYGITLDALATDGGLVPPYCNVAGGYGNDYCPVGSLNVNLSTEPTDVSVGSDTNPGNIFVSSAQADAGGSALESNLGGCSGSPSGVLSAFTEVPVDCADGYGTTNNIPAVQLNVGIGDLYPGGPAQPISFSVTNPGSTGVLVSTVTIGIAQDLSNPALVLSIPGDIGSTDAGCYADWFQINGSPVAFGQTIPPGGTIDWVGAASIQMNNYDTNQDACEGDTVGLNFTSP
ncbi:MAG: hypothetical protein ABSB52_04810 [Acidimicrobiales bacterium]|jgi:hypothetical protein